MSRTFFFLFGIGHNACIVLRQITHTVSDFAIAAFLFLGWRVPEDISMFFSSFINFRNKHEIFILSCMIKEAFTDV